MLHIKSDFAPFCTVSHRLCANLHRASLGAPFNLLKTWSVHQHHCGLLQAVAALKFAQGATIDDKRFCSTCEISASTCLPFNSNTSGSSILHSYRIAQLFQDVLSCCSGASVSRWVTDGLEGPGRNALMGRSPLPCPGSDLAQSYHSRAGGFRLLLRAAPAEFCPPSESALQPT